MESKEAACALMLKGKVGMLDNASKPRDAKTPKAATAADM